MPIGTDKYVREKQAVRKIENGGKPAVTVYEVKETLAYRPPADAQGHGAGLEQKFAVVRLSPKTGRTHQLRVHMAAIGCPIVGDTTYGGRVFESGNLRFDRQALHAYEITFVHPATLKTMTLSAPLPQDMTELLEKMRAGSGKAIPSSGTPGEG